jgi:hypothetical protein
MTQPETIIAVAGLSIVTTVVGRALLDLWAPKKCGSHECIAEQLTKLTQNIINLQESIKELKDNIQRETNEIYPRLRVLENNVAVLGERVHQLEEGPK